MELLILPNTLFKTKYFKEYEDRFKNIVIYEHPQYFKKYKFNKKKLMLHRGSMKYYYDYLKNHGYKVKYINYDKKLPTKKYLYFDPIDKIKINGEMIESPNFILTKELYQKYRDKTDKYLFTNFYMWSKKEIDLFRL